VPAMPEQVTVAMAEIAENMHEGLLASAVGAGLQVMQAMMDADVMALAGSKGNHDAARTAVRHGRERGSVTLGGRRVPVTRPRVRSADGSGELPIASYELFTSTEILGKMAMERCSPACLPAATRWDLNRSASRSVKPLLLPVSRRSRAGLWR
jgi:putative transposase